MAFPLSPPSSCPSSALIVTSFFGVGSSGFSTLLVLPVYSSSSDAFVTLTFASFSIVCSSAVTSTWNLTVTVCPGFTPPVTTASSPVPSILPIVQVTVFVPSSYVPLLSALSATYLVPSGITSVITTFASSSYVFVTLIEYVRISPFFVVFPSSPVPL